MKLIVLCLMISLMLIHITVAKKHHHKRQNDKKRYHELGSVREDSLHSKHGMRHNHHHNHMHKKKKHQKNIKRKDKSKKDERKYLNIREQVRDLSEKINKMLPRCGKDKRCPKNTCCWKGRCKMLPHRVNQRCSDSCPCNGHKKNMFCHIRKRKNKENKYGRCYIKRNSLGAHNLNFIPKTIEKFKQIEKRIAGKKQG